ncbi:hypothetical protein [Gillisia hiemivivida]|nr:hypothetical protein [Gillisia hiemivivida]
MMKKILLSSLFLTAFTLSAQNIDLPTDYVRNTLDGKNDRQKNVVGSPYQNEDFQPGIVTIADKSFNTSIRYNALNDVFETKNQVGEITALIRRPDIKITMDGKQHKIQTYIDDNNMSKQRYFVILAEGETMLLKNEGIEFKEAQQASSSYSQSKPASLVPYTKYYLKRGDQKAVEVNLRKKSILKILDDKRAEKYVKENKLKLKNEEEVVRVLNHYNSL